MGKKVKEYKAGDFIFAKVKGYPAWPARVQKLNGKKYFVYFYGTGETANLPSTMIFDYAENKEKFLTKTQKRKLFNDGVKQIEHDFANNVPIEEVIGSEVEAPADITGNETMNDTGNDTLNDSAAGDSTLDETADESAVANTTQNDAPVEDSDENGALVIDEGKKGKKKPDLTKTPAKETPKAIAKTPRGRAKKVDSTEKQEQEKLEKQDEIVSRSGRKIRPKRFVDEQTEDNSTLPSPVAKKRRAATPPPEKEKDAAKEKRDKDNYNAVSQSELEDLKEPYVPADPEKQNILITYLPAGQYVGIKLFQSSPSAITSFKNEGAKLTYDKQQAKHALTLKTQLERGQITPQSIAAQLVLDLNLTDEEKATLDKERETEEKKSRVQFLKTEMKLIELDAKIKTCLCLEKADTELCLKLLDELQELTLKPLMLLKHPTCVETVKRMRAYVGNTPSWGFSEHEALEFSRRAAAIRKQCDTIYNAMKELFTVPEGLSFWEFFSERVLQFKKATTKLTADELLELVHEPLEMTVPTSHTMKSAIEVANDAEELDKVAPPETPSKKRNTPAKRKKETAAEKEKASGTPSKPDTTEKATAKSKKDVTENAKSKKELTDLAKSKKDEAENAKSKKDGTDNTKSKKDETDNAKSKKDDTDNAKTKKDEINNAKTKKDEKDNGKSKKDAEIPTTPTKQLLKRQSSRNKQVDDKSVEKIQEKKPADAQADKSEPEKMDTDNEQTQSNMAEAQSNTDKVDAESSHNDEENLQETEKPQEKEINSETTAPEEDSTEEEANKTDDAQAETEAIEKNGEKLDDKKEEAEEKQEKEEKEKEEEPRAKRSRETKKTEAPPPRSPNKRKTKA